MRYRVVGLALLAFAVVGCGSSSRKPTSTAAQSEAQTIEALRKKDEANPNIRQEIKAREATEAEGRKGISELLREQQREDREHKQEGRADREAEENSPGSHHYPPAVRAGFLRGCEHSTGHEDSACECAIKRIEARVPLGRYRENEREVSAGRPLPLAYSIQYGYCVGKEAAEGGG